MLNRYFSALILVSTLILPLTTHATIVRFSTALGDIDVNLYDELTPITVENFLSYVEVQSYDNSVIHRSVPGFIIQGGGFSFTPDTPIQTINTNEAILNEPFYSNIRGTIAMAKVGNDPNSATSQWFFNLSDNANNLDGQNGGFTVFGEVIFDDMDAINTIADLTTFNLGGALTDTPLRDYTSEDIANGVELSEENFVTISSVQIIDETVDTLGDTEPTLTTNSSSGGGGGGGGALGLEILLFLLSITALRIRFRENA